MVKSWSRCGISLSVKSTDKPTTIRGFNARVQIDGKWIDGDTSAIPDGFAIVGQPKIDFAGNRLYDRAASNLLEYGKGIRGWLRFSFPGTQPKT